MLEISKKESTTIVVFHILDEMKKNIFGIITMLSLVSLGSFFCLDLNKRYIIQFFFYIIGGVLILYCWSYYKIKIYFKKEIVEIYKIYHGKIKKEISLKYKDIEGIRKVYIGGRADLHSLEIVTFSGKKYEIIKYTSLKADLDGIIQIYEEAKKQVPFYERLREWEGIYLEKLERRYAMVLQEMLKEEKVFLIQRENHFTVNAGEEAIQHLGMFQARKFEEMDFYQFYLDYLSNKEYENSRVRVADNGRDCKEVSMKQLKEDINKLRDKK